MGGVAIQRINTTSGNKFWYETEVTITPGSEQVLLNISVPASEIRVLHSLKVSCRFEGYFRVEDNGTLIGSGRTGPANPDAFMTWAGGRQVDGGNTIVVKFTSRSGAPNTKKVEAYLQTTDSN